MERCQNKESPNMPTSDYVIVVWPSILIVIIYCPKRLCLKIALVTPLVRLVLIIVTQVLGRWLKLQPLQSGVATRVNAPQFKPKTWWIEFLRQNTRSIPVCSCQRGYHSVDGWYSWCLGIYGRVRLALRYDFLFILLLLLLLFFVFFVFSVYFCFLCVLW